MANKARETLEQELPQLEYLRERNIFNTKKLKEIVKKRTQFEYKINRASPTKEDYLKYIQYEVDLENLIRRRKAKKGIVEKKLDEMESFGFRKINVLFQKCTFKFKKDVSLWKQYFKYLKANYSRSLLTKAYSRAIAMNPNEASLWISAAKWEFRNNRNISNCRALFQRGLRLNTNNQALWLTFAKVEVDYTKEIRANFSQENATHLIPAREKKEESISIPALPEEKGIEQQNFISTEETQEANSLNNPLFEGELVRVIFKNAIKAIPNDINFRMQFIDIFQSHSFLNNAINDVNQSLIRDFPMNPETYYLLAKRMLGGNNPQSSFSVFENKLQLGYEISVIEAFIRFCDDISSQNFGPQPEDMITLADNKLEQAFNTAMQQNKFNETIFVVVLNHYIRKNKIKEASDIASNAVSKIQDSIVLWELNMDLLLKLVHQNQITTDSVIKIFEQSLKKLSGSSSAPLWKRYLQFCLETHVEWTQFLRHYQQALAQVAKRDHVSVELRETILNEVISRFGIEEIRKIYSCTFSLPPVSLEFYFKCIDAEKVQSQPDPSKIRLLFERAITEYGTESNDLWLRFIEWETNQMELKRAGNLHWRAKRTLKDPTTFIKKLFVQSNGMNMIIDE